MSPAPSLQIASRLRSFLRIREFPRRDNLTIPENLPSVDIKNILEKRDIISAFNEPKNIKIFSPSCRERVNCVHDVRLFTNVTYDGSFTKRLECDRFFLAQFLHFFV